MQATVLSIAGSDPTGGAGIQADIKTMTTIGVYAAAVISCVTVQNSHGVSSITPLATHIVAEQIQAVLNDHDVTHVKIGMVGTIELADAIGKALHDFQGEVIFDPVLTSSTGQDLFEPQAIQKLHEILLNKTTILTPNLPELIILADVQEIISYQDAVMAAKKLLMKYKKLRVILIKGGHARAGEVITDTLLLKSGNQYREESISHGKIITKNTHGTGCTLASAYAAYHCLTGNDLSSFSSAVGYVQKVLSSSSSAVTVKNPEGQGVMLHYRVYSSGS